VESDPLKLMVDTDSAITPYQATLSLDVPESDIIQVVYLAVESAQLNQHGDIVTMPSLETLTSPDLELVTTQEAFSAVNMFLSSTSQLKVTNLFKDAQTLLV